MSFSVRRATQDDHARLLPVFEQFYCELGLPDAIGDMASTLHALLERADTAVFVAEAGDDVVGAAALSTSFGLEAGLYCELEDLFVVPEWRAKGVASALVDASVAWAERLGCRDMEVVLTPDSQKAERLVSWYADRGFAATGRTILERVLA